MLYQKISTSKPELSFTQQRQAHLFPFDIFYISHFINRNQLQD